MALESPSQNVIRRTAQEVGLRKENSHLKDTVRMLEQKLEAKDVEIRNLREVIQRQDRRRVLPAMPEGSA